MAKRLIMPRCVSDHIMEIPTHGYTFSTEKISKL